MKSIVDPDDAREPAVVSIEAAEIEVDTAFTGQFSTPSDRGIKRDVRPVSRAAVASALARPA